MMRKKEENESFSTLSATILGASEVIFSAFEKNDPETIIINSNDSVLLVREVGKDTLLSILGSFEEEEDLSSYIKDMSVKIKKIRSNQGKNEVLKT